MFDGIFLAKEEKLQVLPLSEQNLMYKVFSGDILYLVGTFFPFSDVTVFMQGLSLETSSLSMKALIAFCCNVSVPVEEELWCILTPRTEQNM